VLVEILVQAIVREHRRLLPSLPLDFASTSLSTSRRMRMAPLASMLDARLCYVQLFGRALVQAQCCMLPSLLLEFASATSVQERQHLLRSLPLDFGHKLYCKPKKRNCAARLQACHSSSVVQTLSTRPQYNNFATCYQAATQSR